LISPDAVAALASFTTVGWAINPIDNSRSNALMESGKSLEMLESLPEHLRNFFRPIIAPTITSVGVVAGIALKHRE